MAPGTVSLKCSFKYDKHYRYNQQDPHALHNGNVVFSATLYTPCALPLLFLFRRQARKRPLLCKSATRLAVPHV
jgi:hypothetical protein